MNDHVTIQDESRRVHCVIDGPIGWLRIDNQPRLNAMSLSMWRELGEGVARLGADPAVRAIVLAGTGGKAFCSGGDISEFSVHRQGAGAMKTYDVFSRVASEALRTVAKPTIALIEGYCLGGGIALALRCDLRIAADSARLGIPAAKLGLSYNFPSIRLLVDLVGPSDAKHILYTGRSYDAAEALQQGLVNEVVSVEDIHSHVEALAHSIADNAPLSIAASKLIVNMTLVDPGERDLDRCEAAEQACLSSEDYALATVAFMEKRQPMFKGY